jgi:PhoH-like ATPase
VRILIKGDPLKKVFVLDTNVLLFDPNSIFKFADNCVFVPLVVVEELDRFKRDQNENGRNARQFARLVDELRKKGSLAKGVELDNGGEFIIGATFNIKGKNNYQIDLTINDNKILAHSIALQEDGKEVVLITKDINLRLKADATNIKSEDYLERDIRIEDIYSGQRLLEVPREIMQTFETERFIPEDLIDDEKFYAHEYLILCEQGNHHYRQLGRYSPFKKGIVPLIRVREGAWGVHPKNVEQQFAFDALLNTEVSLVSLLGKAGTGKTLLAIAAGLEMTISEKSYARVLVSRPIMPMGRDIGYLPGDVNEKLGPWMQPIFDNIDYLFGNRRLKSGEGSWDELINQGLLHIEPLTYIRGRSLPEQYMIVDEAQNLSPHEIKTIITRAGEGTKIVLTGDCEQIDNPYLDSINNGLAYCIDRLKGQEMVAYTMLKVGERSPLSEVASKLL